MKLDDNLFIYFLFSDVNSFEMRLNLIHRIDDEAMQFNVNEKISIQRNNFSQIDNKAFSCKLMSFSDLIFFFALLSINYNS